MCFSSPRCSLLLQDGPSLVLCLALRIEMMERVNNFICLGSQINRGRSVTNKSLTQIQKTPLTSVKLRHLRHCSDIQLPIKGRVYCTTVRSILKKASGVLPLLPS
ncbi:unnamed protein product [Heterobilharzia americana]|nr:unnamed protein product [Heterobilharzia americana]